MYIFLILNTVIFLLVILKGFYKTIPFIKENPFLFSMNARAIDGNIQFEYFFFYFIQKKINFFFFLFYIIIIIFIGMKAYIEGYFNIFIPFLSDIINSIFNNSMCYCLGSEDNASIISSNSDSEENIFYDNRTDPTTVVLATDLFNNLPINTYLNPTLTSNLDQNLEELEIFMEQIDESDPNFARIQQLLNNRLFNTKMLECLSINSIIGFNFDELKINEVDTLLQNLCLEANYLYLNSFSIMQNLTGFDNEDFWLGHFEHYLDSIIFSNKKILYLQNIALIKIMDSFFKFNLSTINTKKILLSHILQREQVNIIFDEYLIMNNPFLEKYYNINRNLFIFLKVFNFNIEEQLNFLGGFESNEASLKNLTENINFSKYINIFLQNQNLYENSIDNFLLNYPNLLNNDIYIDININSDINNFGNFLNNINLNFNSPIYFNFIDLNLNDPSYFHLNYLDLNLNFSDSDSDDDLNENILSDSNLFSQLEKLSTLNLSLNNLHFSKEYIPFPSLDINFFIKDSNESFQLRENNYSDIVITNTYNDIENDNLLENIKRFDLFFRRTNLINYSFIQNYNNSDNNLIQNIENKGFLINRNHQDLAQNYIFSFDDNISDNGNISDSDSIVPRRIVRQRLN